MSAAIPLAQQIRAVERECAVRVRVYPGLVARGKMRAGEAEHEQAAMNAVLKTLSFVEAHETTIRDAIKAERSSAGRST